MTESGTPQATLVLMRGQLKIAKSNATRAKNFLSTDLAATSLSIGAIKHRIAALLEASVKHAVATEGVLLLLSGDDTEADYDTLEAREADYKEQLNLILMEAEEALALAEKSSVSGSLCGDSTHSCSSNRKVRLPELKLPKFDNSLENWPNFIQSFEATIDSDDLLSNLQKLVYLKGQLHGEAEQLLSGLDLDNNSYPVALQILKQTYANPLLLALDQFAKLDKLKIEHHTLEGLRTFRAAFESRIGNLSKLGHKLEGHLASEALLCGTVVGRLPEGLRKVLLNDSNTEILTLKGFRSTLNKEIDLLVRTGVTSKSDGKTHSSSNKTKTTQNSKSRPNTRSTGNKTTSNLNTQTETRSRGFEGSGQGSYRKSCLFCNLESHTSGFCEKFHSLQSRRTKAKEMGRCWFCLRQKHQPEPCADNVHCRRCKKSGHVTAMCDVGPTPVHSRFNKNTDQPTQTHSKTQATATNVCGARATRSPCKTCPNHNDFEDSEVAGLTASVTCNGAITSAATGVILLPFLSIPVQTASGIKRVDTLLDQGSQRSFISKNLVKEQGLKIVGKERLIVNTMAGKQSEQTYEIAQVPIKRCTHKLTYLNAIVVEEIPQQIYPEEVVPVLKRVHKTFQCTSDHLAYQHMDRSRVISSLLIGADYYYYLVRGDVHVSTYQGIDLIPSIYGKVPVGRVPELDHVGTIGANIMSVF